jgi:probable F420-dependent oxidoreductase
MSKGTIPELSIYLPCFATEGRAEWSGMLTQAEIADTVGFDRLLVSDHVVFGERLEEYGRPEVGGIEGGVQPTGSDGHWLEPLITLATIAARTSRIRLRTQILLAALRRPVVLAKSVATLDVLSGGRFELGVGVGWQREEYEAAGLSFEGRGRLLDHTLEVCTTLWRERRASYSSPELNFSNIHQMPKPLQNPGVPIWISGTVRRTTASRIARFGVGWIPWGKDASNLATAIPRLKEAIADAGGDPTSLKVVGNVPIVKSKDGRVDAYATMSCVPSLLEVGVTEFLVPVAIPTSRSLAEETLNPIVREFRIATGRSQN